MADIQRQELACPECRKVYRFDLDFDLDGDHEVICPGCGHTHYRVIENGRITETRYQPYTTHATYSATGYTMVATSTDTNYDTGGTASGTMCTGTGSMFLRDSWLNSTSTY